MPSSELQIGNVVGIAAKKSEVYIWIDGIRGPYFIVQTMTSFEIFGV